MTKRHPTDPGVAQARTSTAALRTLLKRTAPVTMRLRGKFHAFVHKRTKRAFEGLTKRLGRTVFSNASMPRARLHAKSSKIKGWEGKNGGRRRGTAVDKQLSAIVNMTSKRLRLTDAAWKLGKFDGVGLYRLTSIALAALKHHGLRPVCAQRGVCDAAKGCATAADVVCLRETDRSLWLIELKCGFDGIRTKEAKRGRGVVRMRGALADKVDTHERRHMSQLCCTHRMFTSEDATLAALRTQHGVNTVSGALLYVTDQAAELAPMTQWWRHVATRM